MTRVIAISSFMVAILWIANYGDVASDYMQAANDAGQHLAKVRLLDPLVMARAFPVAPATLLAAVIGFFALLRLRAAGAIERRVLRALGAGKCRSESAFVGPACREGPLRSPTKETLTACAASGRKGLPVKGLGNPGCQPERAAEAAYRSERLWPWIALGLAVVAASIAALEFLSPYFFTQDDNFANVLPELLQGYRTLFRGEFPDFDPCQYMGMPIAGTGIYSVFYPPTIIAYAIARWGLRNECLTLEVFAAMHLLGGYVASFAAARVAGMRPALAFALAISFALSGYVLLVGRGWFAVLTLVVWLPLLFCAAEAWFHGRTGWRWLLASGLTLGGFYYMGFVQYWIYALLFFAVAAAAAVVGGRVSVGALRWPAAALVLGISLILPTLVVQLEITRGMCEKPVNTGLGIQRGLIATAIPFPLSRASGFMALPSNRDAELENQMYFAGPILMGGGFVVLGALLAYRCNRRWLAENPWTVAAAASLWLGLGSEGLLWSAVGQLPVLRAVNHHPHRMLPFFIFFALVIGGRFIEKLLRRGRKEDDSFIAFLRPASRPSEHGRLGARVGARHPVVAAKTGTVPGHANTRKWESAIAIVTAGLMLYHVCLSRPSFWCYGDRPYPPLPREIPPRILPDENSQAGRFMWVGPWRSGQPGYACLVPHSLPSAYGALAIGGYDPILENRPETLAVAAHFDESPLEAAKAYGVRWILAANPEHYWPERNYWQAVYGHDWCIGYMEDCSKNNKNGERVIPAAELRFECDELRLLELPAASPMAFDRANPSVSLPVRFHGWGAEVESRGADRTVVVNMSMRPWVRAAADGLALDATADEWGRVAVRVPANVTRFQVFYQLPWRRGLLLGVLLAAAALAVTTRLVSRQERSFA